MNTEATYTARMVNNKREQTETARKNNKKSKYTQQERKKKTATERANRQISFTHQRKTENGLYANIT